MSQTQPGLPMQLRKFIQTTFLVLKGNNNNFVYALSFNEPSLWKNIKMLAYGATTLSIMTLTIMTLSKTTHYNNGTGHYT